MRIINPIKSIHGEFTVPPDKSLSHRLAIFAGLARGESRIENFLFSLDCISTLNCLRSLGIKFSREGRTGVRIAGKPPHEMLQPLSKLFAGNSGTTMRLLTGILAGLPFKTTIDGDDSLRKRPMKRIMEPLSLMGAEIMATGPDENNPPLTITGGHLKGIKYWLPIPSAQVKSCILLAGLMAEGATTIKETFKSRDHTERIMSALNLPLKREGDLITIEPVDKIEPFETNVPGDFSSACFLLTACAILPGSSIHIKKVGLNPTRTHFLNILKRMGTEIETYNESVNSTGEPVGDIHAQWGELKAIKIEQGEVPALIDELPLLAILGAKAKGKTKVMNATELRVKESDRIRGIVRNLRAMGVEIEERADGFLVEGPQNFKGAEIDPDRDHRIAMAMAVAGLSAKGESYHSDPECVNISFPGFWKLGIWGDTGNDE